MVIKDDETKLINDRWIVYFDDRAVNISKSGIEMTLISSNGRLPNCYMVAIWMHLQHSRVWSICTWIRSSSRNENLQTGCI